MRESAWFYLRTLVFFSFTINRFFFSCFFIFRRNNYCTIIILKQLKNNLSSNYFNEYVYVHVQGTHTIYVYVLYMYMYMYCICICICTVYVYLYVLYMYMYIYM